MSLLEETAYQDKNCEKILTEIQLISLGLYNLLKCTDFFSVFVQVRNSFICTVQIVFKLDL